MTSSRDSRLAIGALALGAFAVGTSEFAAMGLLPWYAADLAISEATAGHVVSAYALGVVVGAPVTSLLGARFSRRAYLAVLIALYGVMNLCAAVMPGYLNLVGARFFAGLPHGGFLGVSMLFAADALPREQRAKGIAQVLLGLTFASVVGVPFAGFLGQSLGWRWGFGLPGVLGLLSALLILRYAPRVAATSDANPARELRALANPGVWAILAVGAVGFGGIFAVYAYLSAAMLATTQPPGWAVPLALSMFGVGATLGSMLAAGLTLRIRPFGAVLVIGVFAALSQAFASYAVGNWPLMVVSALLLGLGSSTFVPLQTQLMEVAGDAQSMAAAMNHAAFNAANALGPWAAGLALSAGFGYRSSGLVGVGFSLGGLVMLGVAFVWSRRAADATKPAPQHVG